MGLSQSVDERDRKTIEFDIFDKSFELIEKYVKTNTKGMSQRFRTEYRIAGQSTDKGYVDWSRVLDRHHRHGRDNMGYIEAIKVTGKLLAEARRVADRKDKKTIADIYRSADRLIHLRKEELDPKLAVPLLGWVIWGGDEYNKHQVVVNAWKEFKNH